MAEHQTINTSTATGLLEQSSGGSALQMLEALPTTSLSDEQFELVKAIAKAPLPSPASINEQEFGMAMKLLEASLPRRKDDTDTGELKFRAYRKCLSHLPKVQLWWTVEEAIKRQRFFPTVKELLDIADQWIRSDDATKAHRLARHLANRETNRRHIASTRKPAPPLTKDMIDRMDPAMVSMGLKCGALIERDGRVIPNPEPDEASK